MSAVSRRRVDLGQLQNFVRKHQAADPAVTAEWQDEGSLELMRRLRQNTPVRTGLLRESIARRDTPKGFTVYFTQPYDRIAAYLERGTRAHTIVPRNPQGTLSWTGSFGEQRFAKRVHHPGFQGRFFIARTKERFKPYLKDLYRRVWIKHHK